MEGNVHVGTAGSTVATGKQFDRLKLLSPMFGHMASLTNVGFARLIGLIFSQRVCPYVGMVTLTQSTPFACHDDLEKTVQRQEKGVRRREVWYPIRQNKKR